MGSVDQRCRWQRDIRDFELDELIDSVFVAAIANHGELAGHGVEVMSQPDLGLVADGREISLRLVSGALRLAQGLGNSALVAELNTDALSDLVQDRQSTMGLAMTSRVKILRGSLDDWIRWEPVLRALFEGRPVYEPGAVVLRDLNDDRLDLERVFTLGDDLEEMSNFLSQAGFLHLRGVFDEVEMASVGSDIDDAVKSAEPDSSDYWWCTNTDGDQLAVRVLNFQDRSSQAAELIADERIAWVGSITGDGHLTPKSCEGLVKPLDVVSGLSDLPWHKDCGQGLHSYKCNSLTVGVSVTGADRVSGALGVVPGSNRANTVPSMRDRTLDLKSRLLETDVGDLTVHCSDTLHRAYPPSRRSRKVVYTSLSLPPQPGDTETPNRRYSRSARSELSSVRDRIEAADNEDAANPFVAAPTDSRRGGEAR